MALSIRTRPSFPLSQSLPSGSFHKPYPSQSEGRKTENHNHRKLTNLITWTTALSNSMKLWAMPSRATQDGRVMVVSSDKMWSTGEWNGKPLQHSCLENPMNSMKNKKKKIWYWKMNPCLQLYPPPPRSLSVQYATREEWRNSSRRNKEAEP